MYGDGNGEGGRRWEKTGMWGHPVQGLVCVIREYKYNCELPEIMEPLMKGLMVYQESND